MNLSTCDDLTFYSESNKFVRSDKSDKRLRETSNFIMPVENIYQWSTDIFLLKEKFW